MINKIIDAISIAIFNEFGEDYTIYTESVEQGLKTPCFFINTLKPSQKLFKFDKYFQTNPLCIQYISDEDDIKHKCNEVRERLYSCLEYITIIEDKENNIKSLIRGTNMSGEYSDNILNFFVNYDMFVKKKEAKKETIDSYNYDSTVTKGDSQ